MKYTLLSLCILLFACQTSKKNKKLTANAIVKKAINYAGGKKYDSLQISFDFRGTQYKMTRNHQEFEMKRKMVKDSNTIIDTYTNDTFQRQINNQPTTLSDSMASVYRQSINSVFYFALLPYKLEDAAVQKTDLGIDTIKGKPYHLIQVKFKEEGGGDDFQDTYLYWFDKNNFALVYLAYTFYENGGGMRFRKAYNERFVNGIRLVDYLNFKPQNKSVKLKELSSKFNQDQLKLLSKIELKNIRVD